MSNSIKRTVPPGSSTVNPSTLPTKVTQQPTERQQPTPSSLTSLNLNQTRVWGDETPPPTTGSGGGSGSVSFASTPERDPWNFPAVETEYRKNLATPEEYKILVSEGKVPPEIDGTEAPVEKWREFGAKGEVPPERAKQIEEFSKAKGRPTTDEIKPTVSDTTPV